MKRGMNSSEMQRNNRSLVFKTLLRNGSMTRTELAAQIGLQKATITNIINSFLEIGIVGIDGMAAGRRGEDVYLKLDGIYILSMGITRKDYQIGVFSLDGKQVDYVRCKFVLNEKFDEVVEKMKKNAAEMENKYGKKKLIGVSLAVPGLYIIRKNGGDDIFQVSEFEQLSRVNIREELEGALGLPVLMKHDAKLGAYAEWKNSEEAQKNENATLINIRSRGYGIGAGIVVRGKILEGQIGIAGELGHIGINFNRNRSVNSDTGAFEYCAGTESAVRYMLERLHEFPDSTLNENSTYQDIADAYQKGDPLAVWAIEKMAWMLGYGIANIVYIINPDCIILGSDYPDTDQFINKVRESTRQFLPTFVGENLNIRFSELREDPFLLGGYYYLLERLCEENTIMEKIREAID